MSLIRHFILRLSVTRFAIMFNMMLFMTATLSTYSATAATAEDMKRLNNNLMKRYNKNVLPSKHPRLPVELLLGLKLDQIVKIDERNQVMTTNVWLIHEWSDSKLVWNPDDFGGIQRIEIPSLSIWLPDVVLYNNADGTFVVNTFNWAYVYHNGTVKWSTPVTYKSQCDINIQYYPFDIQNCSLKFGVWSHGKKQIVLRHQSLKVTADPGIDLSSYEQSVEWDLLSVPSIRHEIEYECCPDDSFLDVTFCLEIRRKSLFYTVNLVAPCICIAFLAIMVFHVPSASGEKMTLSISILVALQVFYLLMIEILPSTSVHVPLLGKYLLFTFVFVNISIILALIIANIHFRDPKMHKMPLWVKRLFFEHLPPFLFMDVPALPSEFIQTVDSDDSEESDNEDLNSQFVSSKQQKMPESDDQQTELDVIRMNFKIIHRQKRSELKDKVVADGWAFIALVLDRIFLLIYSFVFVVGTTACLLSAPSLYDHRKPLAGGKHNINPSLSM